MSDHVEEVRAALAHLQAELHEAEDLNAATHEKLHATLAELQAMLEKGPLSPNGIPPHPVESPLRAIVDRLSEAEKEFQASHPTLSGFVGSAIDALGRMGI